MANPWRPDPSVVQGRPRYRAIAEALATDIAEGRLVPGTRLPTHRDLAEALGVTVGTVTRAYAEAERRGLIAATVGRGTFVTPGSAPLASPVPDRTADGTGAAGGKAGETGRGRGGLDFAFAPDSGAAPAALTDQDPGARAESLLDLSANYPVASLLGPALAPALSALSDPVTLAAAGAYQAAPGAPDHRAAGAAWLARVGLSVAAEDVVVTAGCQHGLAVSLGALLSPGAPLLVESLAWPGLVALARQQGYRLMPVAMDAEGLVPEALAEAAQRHGARVAYCMPTLHNPTATTMPRARREALLEVAAAQGLTLVEDDIYGFLRPEAPPPLAALDPQRAVYVTSLSKSVAPGLRIGYVTAPRRLIPAIAAAVRATSIMASPLTAELATRLIADGHAASAAEHQRAAARDRQRLVHAHLPARGLATAPESFHLWLNLPRGWSGGAFARAALAQGVGVTPGDAFTADGHDPGGVRLCLCAVADPARLERALKILGGLLAENPARSLPVV